MRVQMRMPDPARDHVPPRAPVALAVAIALATLVLYLPGIGVGDFVGDDEALDAGVVWEMARGGDWLFPEFNGEYLPPKPPLFYWSARVAAAAQGKVDEWSLRAPSAVAAAATVGLTVIGAAPLIGRGAASLAALMFATMPVVRAEARSGRCDMLLTLLVTACLLLVAQPRPAPRARAWLAWLLLGLAALCKGGAGVGLIFAVLVAEAIVSRDFARVRGLVGVAIVAFVLVGGSWYGLAAWHWGRRFVDEQIIGENLHHLIGGSGISDRGASTEPLRYHLTYYLGYLFVTTFPWGLSLPLALPHVWRGTDRSRRFFVYWLAAGMVFFTAVSRKSPYYLLPLTPAVAVLCAAWASERLREALPTSALELGISRRRLTWLFAAAVAAWLGARMLPARRCEIAAVAGGLGAHPLTTIGAVWLLLSSLSALPAGRRRGFGVLLAATLCAAASVILLADRLDGPLDNCGSLKPFAREVRAHVGPEERVAFFREPLPAVALYAERRIPTARETPPPRPFYLIVPESLASGVPASWIAGGTTVVRGYGRVFTHRRMGIELVRVGESGHEGDQVALGALLRAEHARHP